MGPEKWEMGFKRGISRLKVSPLLLSRFPITIFDSQIFGEISRDLQNKMYEKYAQGRLGYQLSYCLVPFYIFVRRPTRNDFCVPSSGGGLDLYPRRCHQSQTGTSSRPPPPRQRPLQYVQGSAKRQVPGPVSFAGQARQKG